MDVIDSYPLGRREEPGPEALPTEDLLEVGEVTTRVAREAIVQPLYNNIASQSKVEAFVEVIAFAEEEIRAAGQYDDTRALSTLIIRMRDRIREVSS